MDGFSGDSNPGSPIQVDDAAGMGEEYYYTPDEIERHQAREHQKMLRIRRRHKKKQVFLNRLRLGTKLCFALGMLVALWQLMTSPFWRYDQPIFSLENNHLITRQQILPLLRPYIGQPLPLLNTVQLAKAIKRQSSVVDYVAIRRHLFPARLTILVKEKTPWAQVSSHVIEAQTPPVSKKMVDGQPVLTQAPKAPAPILAKPYALLTPKGAIALSSASHLAPYSPKLYPHQHIEAIMLQPQTRYSNAYLNKLKSYIWKARHLAGLHLQWTDARQPNHVVFHFQETEVVLGRLNDSAEQRLLRVLVLLPKLKELKEAVSGVDLQWEEQITFHTKPNIKLEAPQPPKTDG